MDLLNSSGVVSAQDILLVLVVLFFVVGGLLFLANLFIQNKLLRQELWLAYKLEFIVVAVFLVPAYFGGWFFLVAVLLFNARALWELLSVFKVDPSSSVAKIGFIASSAALVAVFFFGETYVGVILLLTFLLFQASFFFKQTLKQDYLSIAASLLLLLVPLIYFIVLRDQKDGFLWLFFVYLVIEVNDAFALLVGKLVGRYHPFPVLSPKKTIEGILGGFAFSLIVGMFFSIMLLKLSWLIALAAVLTILLSGVFGDLLISALKRSCQTKDFPAVHASMGGVLDIYDAVLFAVPVFYGYLFISMI